LDPCRCTSSLGARHANRHHNAPECRKTRTESQGGLVLPTSGPANCRLHSTVVLACGADSNDHAKLNAVVYCRCRGEQLQDTFARSLHQSSRIAVCQPAVTTLAYSHRLTRTGLLAGLLHLGLHRGSQLTHVGSPVACGQVS